MKYIFLKEVSSSKKYLRKLENYYDKVQIY